MVSWTNTTSVADGICWREKLQRVATQLGYELESMRAWVTPADIDAGEREGVPSDSAVEIRRLEQELREVKRANEILKRAASFFRPVSDRRHKR
jgi:transposase-like protein